ncbi:MAG TPA: hypothetical protein VGJ20_29285 [Xanthobacteraceae bacterium]
MQSKEEHFQAVGDLAFKYLNNQRLFILKDEYFIEDKNGNINGKALGYVLSFLDVFLLAKGLEIRDGEGKMILLRLLARLFPAEAPRVAALVLHLRGISDNDEIMNGMMVGGQDAVEFLRDNKIPVRWPTCFSAELADPQ